MVTSSIDFPTWFSIGCYGGLACCMFSIAVNALYTTMRKRGTTRQLAGAIVLCVVSALLLLPAIIWYNVRFIPQQTAISFAEVEVILVYIVLWGWFLPLSITVAYCLFTLPRISTNSTQMPRQQPVHHARYTTRLSNETAYSPPRQQPGVLAPFVFGEDTPWGWLEHRNGRFQGLRLSLKRAIITIGREDDNDIWLVDDDQASRNHAELTWDQGTIYITDCNSTNGVFLDEQPIHGTAIVEQGMTLKIGSHYFICEKAQHTEATEQDDPLMRHVWHSASSLSSTKIPVTKTDAVNEKGRSVPIDAFDTLDTPNTQLPRTSKGERTRREWEEQETADLPPIVTTPPPATIEGAFTILDGELAGHSFLFDRAIITLGRGIECEVMLHDASISRIHARITQRGDGNYVEDLGSHTGTTVNNEPVQTEHLIHIGDVVSLGTIRLEYISVQTALTTPLSRIIEVASTTSGQLMSGPIPLRLPSKMRLS